MVGSQYVCLSCLTRGVAIQCARCLDHESVVDLTTKEGRQKLASLRASVRLGAMSLNTVSMHNLKMLPIGRKVIWALSRFAFVAGAIGWIVARPQYNQATQLAAAIFISFVMGGCAVVLTYVLVLIAMLGVVGAAAIYALSCNGLSRLCAALGAHARAAQIASRGDRTLDRVLAWTERAFVLRIKVDSSLHATAEHRALEGVLSGPPLRVLSDPSSDFELRDVLRAHFDVLTSAEHADAIRVECDHGVIEVDDTARLSDEPGRGATLAPDTVLSWLPVDEHDRAKWRHKSIGAGVLVQITGGEWHQEIDPSHHSSAFRKIATRTIIRGTATAPLFLKILSQPKR